MAELIYTLNKEDIEKFCATTFDEDGDEEILGYTASYGKRRGYGRIARIEIYIHDEITKNYLADAEGGSYFFALAYNEEGRPCWYCPAQAISNAHYIPVLDEWGYWSWKLISPHVLDHVLKTYNHVRISDDGKICFKNERRNRNIRDGYRRQRKPRI